MTAVEARIRICVRCFEKAVLDVAICPRCQAIRAEKAEAEVVRLRDYVAALGGERKALELLPDYPPRQEQP